MDTSGPGQSDKGGHRAADHRSVGHDFASSSTRLGRIESNRAQDGREAAVYVYILLLCTHTDVFHADLHIYPGICTFTAGCLAAVAGYDMISSWSQTVRDKEFLVEMRLQNLEPGQGAKGELDMSEDGPDEDDVEEI